MHKMLHVIEFNEKCSDLWSYFHHTCSYTFDCMQFHNYYMKVTWKLHESYMRRDISKAHEYYMQLYDVTSITRHNMPSMMLTT